MTTTQYDVLNRATTITDGRSGQTVYVYDAAGRRTVIVDPNGNRTSYVFDAADRVTTITDPRGSTTTFVYDAANELTDRTDRDGRRVTFAYDSGGRLTNERWLASSGGTVRTITYSYDNANQLTGITDPDATLTFTYDSGGRRLTEATSSTAGQPSVTLTSGYNATDKTSLTDNLSSVGRTTFVYDSAHRLTTLTQSSGGTAGPQVIFGYDNANHFTSLSRTINGTGTAVNTTISYDGAERVSTITHQLGGGSILATYVYAYDSADRVTTETNAEGTVTYSYDNANELTAAGGSRTESYGYDSGGNRNTAGYTTVTGNELTAAPGETYTYDAEGNQTGKTDASTSNTWTFTYDYRNRLTGVTEKNSGGTVIMQATYTYDALNRRIGTNVDDDGAGPHSAVQTWIVYDGQNTYADFNGSGALQKRYLYGPAIDFLIARTDSGGTSVWYLTDRLGSVRDVVSTSGTILDHVVYDSNGKVTTETNLANGDRFKYTGREYDTETGNYFYRARAYDPTLGRFMSRDPAGFDGGDTNLYRYVGNAPIDAIDPSGKLLLPIQFNGASIRLSLPNNFTDIYNSSADLQVAGNILIPSLKQFLEKERDNLIKKLVEENNKAHIQYDQWIDMLARDDPRLDASFIASMKKMYKDPWDTDPLKKMKFEDPAVKVSVGLYKNPLLEECLARKEAAAQKKDGYYYFTVDLPKQDKEVAQPFAFYAVEVTVIVTIDGIDFPIADQIYPVKIGRGVAPNPRKQANEADDQPDDQPGILPQPPGFGGDMTLSGAY